MCLLVRALLLTCGPTKVLIATYSVHLSIGTNSALGKIKTPMDSTIDSQAAKAVVHRAHMRSRCTPCKVDARLANEPKETAQSTEHGALWLLHSLSTASRLICLLWCMNAIVMLFPHAGGLLGLCW